MQKYSVTKKQETYQSTSALCQDNNILKVQKVKLLNMQNHDPLSRIIIIIIIIIIHTLMCTSAAGSVELILTTKYSFIFNDEIEFIAFVDSGLY